MVDNSFEVEGIVSEIDFREGSFTKNGVPTEYIGGTIKVLVESNNGSSIVPVDFFSSKLTSQGAVSKMYTQYKDAASDYVSIASCGEAAKASKIRITGSLRMDDYMKEDGTVVPKLVLNGKFINKVTFTFKPHATFNIDAAIKSIIPCVDNDGAEVEPRRLNVTVLVPQPYNNGSVGPMNIITLVAENPITIDHVENDWEVNGCYHIKGRINYTTKTITKPRAASWGEEDESDERTIQIKELIITGGSEEAFDDNEDFSYENLQAGLNARTAKLEAQKLKKQAKKTATTASSSTTKKPDLSSLNLGF